MPGSSPCGAHDTTLTSPQSGLYCAPPAAPAAHAAGAAGLCVSTYVDRGGLWPYCAAPLPPATAAAGCFLKVRIGNLCGDSRLKAFGYLNRVTKMSSSKLEPFWIHSFC